MLITVITSQHRPPTKRKDFLIIRLFRPGREAELIGGCGRATRVVVGGILRELGAACGCRAKRSRSKAGQTQASPFTSAQTAGGIWFETESLLLNENLLEQEGAA